MVTAIIDTFLVQGDVIATDVRLPMKRLRREAPSDFDTDKDIEVYQVCHCFHR